MSRLARSLTVGLVSASTLAYEILLVRAFAIEHFNHFAYMAIGVAMLGYGTSGTLLAVVRRPDRHQAERWFSTAAMATPFALIAITTLVHLISLDATQLLWDTAQWPRLIAVYTLLAVPFGVGALTVLLALTLEGDRPGWIYGASFLGSGLGALLAVAILWILFPDRALAVPAVVAALAALSATRGSAFPSARGVLAWALLLLAIGSVLRPMWTLQITPYKGQPQVEAYPEARRVAERTSPVGWVVAVEADAFRHAPGLSLSYRGEFPRQTALFVDGQLAGAVSDWRGGDAAAILDWLSSAAPYTLLERPRVLVLGAGDGVGIWTAIQHDARRIVGVELHPDIVDLAARLSEPEARAELSQAQWAVGDARHYVARTRNRFDLITLGPGGSFGTSATGVHSLNEDFLHTVEAYAGYLDRLDDDGLLAVTRWVTTPPRGNVRVILTAVEALRRFAPSDIERKIAVVRSWATTTVMIRPHGFSAADVDALKEWSQIRRFDLDWYPGATSPTSEFNIMEAPTLFEAAAAAVVSADSAERFASAQPFDVAPVHDSRPYPHHFLKTESLRAFLRSDRGSWLPFAEWGYIALLATLAQSVLLAGLLLIVPAVVRTPAVGRRDWLRLVTYFGAIGLAYLAAEIAAIQQLNLLLGHPVYAVAGALAAFLTFSGLGSAWSDRVPAVRGWAACVALAGVLALSAALLLSLGHLVQPAHLIVRATAAIVILAPLAFLMGLPFPLGLRLLAGGEVASVAWAWAANGFASVIGAPLAALIAIEAGSRVLFLVAGAAYVGAALVQVTASRAFASAH